MMPLREQFSGCLIGQCLGDALGFPVEGYPPSACRQYVNQVLLDARAGSAMAGRGPFPFGQYTDDSQLARELLQSYLECGRFDPEDYAGRIAAIFRENRIVGRGRATESAAHRLGQGVPWEEAGTPAPSAGNGSAMRAGPVGLLFHRDPPGLVQAAHDQGRITHRDRRCSAGAVAIAGAVALGLSLHGRPIERGPFLSKLARWVGTYQQSVAAGVQKLIHWVDLPPEQAVTHIADFGKEPGYADGWRGISPFVTGSVLWSLYAFLRSPLDYWGTICTAIAVGGDVDTTAAMAGAISGAYLGLEAIPLGLAEHLTDQGTWGYAELVNLAGRCYDLRGAGAEQG
jgi:ADP-ribosylglycohydrolase